MIKKIIGKKKLRGGVLGIIGFLLSPLSRRNDLLINFPLAYGFAWLFSFGHEPWFFSLLILGYWMTNVLGFVLLHHGAQDVLSDDDSIQTYTLKDLQRDVFLSVLYTGVIVILIALGYVRMPG